MDVEKNARIYAGIPEDSPQDLKYCVIDKKAKYDAFIAGANWQKEQILDSNTTLQRAFELGKQEIKQQMMAKAIDGTVRPDDGEIWCDLKSFDFKDGDKVKVIVIKEE